MAVKVSDLANLKGLKKVHLVAGESGLRNEVTTLCLADLEVDNNLVPYANGFRRGSFVISSMRDNGSKKKIKFQDIIEGLLKYKCSGLAYNSRMTKKPSQAVIDFCEANEFPLFAFDPTEVYIENFIFEAMKAINESSVSFSLDREITRMLEDKISKEEISEIIRSINPNLQRRIVVCYIWPKDLESDFNPGKIARNYRTENHDEDIVASLLTYRDGLVVLFSMPKIDLSKRDAFIEDIIKSLDMKKEDLRIASSSQHFTFEDLDLAFRECRKAYIVARVENKSKVEYDDIGIYQLLIEHMGLPENANFVKKYLDDMNREQLETAIEYVLSDGDFDEVARKLICHRNTVRYRIGKIHERTDPNATDYQFYENLSAAIKLYLVSNI